VSFSAYRIVDEPIERLPRESLRGQIAKCSVTASAPFEDARCAFCLAFEPLEDLRNLLTIDPVAPEVVADQGIAAVLGRETPCAGLRETGVGEQAGGGELVERLVTFLGRDPGTAEPQLELPARAVSVAERAKRELSRLGHLGDQCPFR
jgi:hypothetical protein